MTAANVDETAGAHAAASIRDYVTVTVADQVFGLPIDRVHDVFLAASLTKVPLAPVEIAGLINLRGRVVTAVCLRRRLGLPKREGCGQDMTVGLEHQGESYGLVVDAVGEVVRLSPETHEPNPVHLDEAWARVSRGVHRLDGKLLIILDVACVLAFGTDARAA